MEVAVPVTTIYVGNLPPPVDEHMLYTAFSGFGSITACEVGAASAADLHAAAVSGMQHQQQQPVTGFWCVQRRSGALSGRSSNCWNLDVLKQVANAP